MKWYELGSGDLLPGTKSWLHHLLAEWHWTSYLKIFCASFFICTAGLTAVSNLRLGLGNDVKCLEPWPAHSKLSTSSASTTNVILVFMSEGPVKRREEDALLSSFLFSSPSVTFLSFHFYFFATFQRGSWSRGVTLSMFSVVCGHRPGLGGGGWLLFLALPLTSCWTARKFSCLLY